MKHALWNVLITFLIAISYSNTTMTVIPKEVAVEMKDSVVNNDTVPKSKPITITYSDIKAFKADTTKIDTVKLDTSSYHISKTSGYKLIAEYNGGYTQTILLLAAYINTQSRGDKSDKYKADRYGVAQVIVAQMKRSELNIKQWLTTKSSTVRNRKSNYFWVDSGDYYSNECIKAATDVLANNIPNEYSVEDAQAFLHEPSITPSVRAKWKPSKIVRKFIHTFYKF